MLQGDNAVFLSGRAPATSGALHLRYADYTLVSRL